MARARQVRSLLIENADTVDKHGLFQATNEYDFIAFVQGNLGHRHEKKSVVVRSSRSTLKGVAGGSKRRHSLNVLVSWAGTVRGEPRR